MAEQIIDKQCIVCKQTKPLQDFRIRSDSKDGHRNDCCLCENARNLGRYHTPDGKKLAAKRLRKYHQSKKGKLCYKKAKLKYYQTEKGKQHAIKDVRKYQQKHPLYNTMHSTVSRAIRSGKLPPAKTLKCNECKKTARDYHHHLGYARKHWLDVIPVCRLCHVHLHISQREAIVRIESA